MTNARLLYALIGLGLLLTGCAQPPPETAERVVPAQFCGHYIFLEFEFANHPGHTMRMVFDSGASTTLVDPDSIERIFGKRVRAGKRVKLSDFSAGPLRFNTLTVKATELDHIAQAFGDEHFDGILGFTAFKQVLLTIDYPAREVRVATGTLPKPDGVEVFRYTGKKRPWLKTTVNGRKTTLLIDTGAGSPIAINDKHDLDWSVDPIYLSCAVRMDRIEQRDIGRLAGDVVFGPITFEDPIIERTDGTELVGGGLLKNFTLTFDQRTKRIRMTPTTPATPTSDATPTTPTSDARVRIDPVRSTGMVATLDDLGIRVVHIVPQSPAETGGLAVDDVIISLNGLEYLSDGCALRNLNASDLDEVTYAFLRDGERHEVTVPIVEMIP